MKIQLTFISQRDNCLSGAGQGMSEGEPAGIQSRVRLEDLVTEKYSELGEENADHISGDRRSGQA